MKKTINRSSGMVLLAGAAVLWSATAAAAGPVAACIQGKNKAADKRAKCLFKAESFGPAVIEEKRAVCETRFDEGIAAQDAKAANKGAACRYLDRGDTVWDLNTLYEWEKKTDDGGVHDKGDTYSWSATGTAPDGTMFTDFLPQLSNCHETDDPGSVNSGFAGHCDWEIPDIVALRTIVDCSNGAPCVDPIFGPTAASFYWSSTSVASGPSVAWGVFFGNGFVGSGSKGFVSFVRAVRGGR